jgi:CrcB protein
MLNYLSIAIGGCLGAVSRYSLSRFIYNTMGTTFPWGTFTVNIIGCFFIGFFYDFFEKILVSYYARNFISVGFIGAFTTFSTFSMESVALFASGEYKEGCINIVLSNVCGITFVILGMLASRVLLRIVK